MDIATLSGHLAALGMMGFIGAYVTYLITKKIIKGAKKIKGAVQK
jgi:hypothetical protein